MEGGPQRFETRKVQCAERPHRKEQRREKNLVITRIRVR